MQNFEKRHIFMPELPDLEVFRGNIFKKISSKRLIGLEVFSQKNITPQASYYVNKMRSYTSHKINFIWGHT